MRHGSAGTQTRGTRHPARRIGYWRNGHALKFAGERFRFFGFGLRLLAQDAGLATDGFESSWGGADFHLDSDDKVELCASEHI